MGSVGFSDFGVLGTKSQEIAASVTPIWTILFGLYGSMILNHWQTLSVSVLRMVYCTFHKILLYC